jgi:Ser/Thr protein kinase RdoA (MazF antagonist)
MSNNLDKIENEEDWDILILDEAKAVMHSYGFVPQEASFNEKSPHVVIASGIDLENRNNSLILKWTKSNPSTQIAILSTLVEEGFDLIPDYIECERDSACLQARSGRYWTCQPFVGSEFSYDWLDFDCPPQHCFHAGEALAKLHAIGAQAVRHHGIQFSQTHKTKTVISSLAEKLAKTFERLEKLEISKPQADASKFKSKKNKAQTARENAISLLKRLPFQRLCTKAEELSAELLKVETSLTQTINHGDFHPGNILFSTGSILAVVDWEYMSVGSSMLDLGYALFMFCLQPPMDGIIDQELFSSRKTEAFLDGYNYHGLSLKGFQYLEKYSELVHLLVLDWLCNELCKMNNAKAPSKYQQYQALKYPDLALALTYCCQ